MGYFVVACFTKAFLIATLYRYMGALHNDNDESKNSSPALSGALLTLTFVDTTWRMAIPSVGLTIVGLLLDRKFGTKPWLMLIGAVVGSMIAVYLVRIQLKRVMGKTAKKQ